MVYTQHHLRKPLEKSDTRHIVRIRESKIFDLEEDFSFAELKVGIAQDCLADLAGRCPAVLCHGGADPRHQDAIPVDKLGERVAYRVPSPTDPTREWKNYGTQRSAEMIGIFI